MFKITLTCSPGLHFKFYGRTRFLPNFLFLPPVAFSDKARSQWPSWDYIFRGHNNRRKTNASLLVVIMRAFTIIPFNFFFLFMSSLWNNLFCNIVFISSLFMQRNEISRGEIIFGALATPRWKNNMFFYLTLAAKSYIYRQLRLE